MITIYHLGVSQSDRIVWLMEELGLPYQLEWFDRDPQTRLAPPEYKALHPVATAPTIRDGDLVMCESLAIVEYIINRYAAGRLGVAPDLPNYPDYLYWMSFAVSLIGTFSMKMAFSAGGGSENFYVNLANDREQRYLNHLERRLGESDYLAGPAFTATEIMNLFNLTTLPLFGGPSIDHLPNTTAYVERVSQRPAYQKAMSIAGPSAARPDA